MAAAATAQAERTRQRLTATIRAMAAAMETGDPNQQGHSQRVTDYCTAIATQMAVPIDDIRRLRVAALIHDAGKMVVRLTLPGATPEQVRDQHVQAGEKLLTGIEGFDPIMAAVRYHHERADGSGYPYKVKNADMPLLARILIVANSFDDACTSAGAASPPSKDVIKDMSQKGGTEYDDEVIKALVICHRNGSLYGATNAPSE